MLTALEVVRAETAAAVTFLGLFSPQGSFSRVKNPWLPGYVRQTILELPTPDHERGAEASNGGYDSPAGLEDLAAPGLRAGVRWSLETRVGDASGQE